MPVVSIRALGPRLAGSPRECEDDEAGERPHAGQEDTMPAKLRLARLARTIEADVIPRLVQSHRVGALPRPAAAVMGHVEADTFLRTLTQGTDRQLTDAVQHLRDRGLALESIYLDLFTPTARRLGEMWEEDSCDFSTVTLALGRLQRLLRELSPAFGTEVEHPLCGRRALFAQPPEEQHSFGLSMVAEFFRRDGWDVVGGVGTASTDPARRVREEWVDAVGFSVGSDVALPWLRQAIARVRAASCNPDIAVIVGGAPFIVRPERAAEVGADGTARSGKEAPVLAEKLLSRGNASRKQ